MRHLGSREGHKRRRIGQWVRDPLSVGGGNGGALGRLQGPSSVETLASSSSVLPAQNGRRRPNPLHLRYGRPGAAQTAAPENAYAYSRKPTTSYALMAKHCSERRARYESCVAFYTSAAPARGGEEREYRSSYSSKSATQGAYSVTPSRG